MGGSKVMVNFLAMKSDLVEVAEGARVAVKITDMLGEEVLVVKEM